MKRKRSLLIPLLVAGLGILGYHQGVFAQVTNLSEESQKQIESNQDKIDELNKQIKSYQQIADLKKRQGASISDQLEGIAAQNEAIRLQLESNQDQLGELNGTIENLETRIKEKETLIEQQKLVLKQLLRTYYQDSSYELTPVVLTVAEAADYFQQSEWNADASQKVTELLHSIQGLRDGLEKEKESLGGKKQNAVDLQAQLESRNTYLEASQASKERILARTTQDASKYSGIVDSLQQEKEDLEAEIEDIEAGRANLLVGLPKGGSGVLAYPVENPRITQGYGKTSYSNHYSSGLHNGMDFGASTGTKVMAPADGTVVGTGDLGGYAYGKWITIDHGNGLVTLYGHLSRISVSKGEKVKEGEKIGEIGSTGFSTGSHLHFTVYASRSYEVIKASNGKSIPVGASVNPARYLP